MPPRKRATTDLEEDFDKPVSIEFIDALARPANLQETGSLTARRPGCILDRSGIPTMRTRSPLRGSWCFYLTRRRFTKPT